MVLAFVMPAQRRINGIKWRLVEKRIIARPPHRLTVLSQFMFDTATVMTRPQ